MKLTEPSTRHWPSVVVALAARSGVPSIVTFPIQLLPTIEEPQVSIANLWRAGAPEEMEASILRSGPNLLVEIASLKILQD